MVEEGAQTLGALSYLSGVIAVVFDETAVLHMSRTDFADVAESTDVAVGAAVAAAGDAFADTVQRRSAWVAVTLGSSSNQNLSGSVAGMLDQLCAHTCSDCRRKVRKCWVAVGQMLFDEPGDWCIPKSLAVASASELADSREVMLANYSPGSSAG